MRGPFAPPPSARELRRLEAKAQRRSHRATHKKAGELALPINIRFSSSDELKLQLSSHNLLDLFRAGEADEPDWHALALRLNWGRFLAEQHFPDGIQPLADAQDALRAVKERNARTGKWGCSQPEFAAMGQGLNCTDEMQLQCTRRELRDALEAVYGANEYASKLRQIEQEPSTPHHSCHVVPE